MLKIHVFNVGLGDSLIIETYKGTGKYYSIIDCKKHQGRCPTVEFLEENNIKDLECIFLSHLHADHFSGFSELAEYLQRNAGTVKYLVSPISSTELKSHLKFILEINTDKEEKNLRVQFLKAWEKITQLSKLRIRLNFEGDETPNAFKTHLHSGLSIAPLSPTPDQASILLDEGINNALKNGSLVNSVSHVLVIRHDSTNKYMLLPGDLEGKTWRWMKNRVLNMTGGDIKNNFVFLKAPHHGSYDQGMADSIKELITQDAAFGVSVSCPANDIDHPNLLTLKYFKNNYKNSQLACTNVTPHCTPVSHAMIRTFVTSPTLSEFTDVLSTTKDTKFISSGLSCAGNHIFQNSNTGWNIYRNGRCSF